MKRGNEMRTLIIDRFEGNFAICEDENQKYFGIDQGEIPKDAKEGDILEIDQEGNIRINQEVTEKIMGIKSKKEMLSFHLWITSLFLLYPRIYC